MAERVGFEPTVRRNAQRFSRPPQSTTLAPLHQLSSALDILRSNQKLTAGLWPYFSFIARGEPTAFLQKSSSCWAKLPSLVLSS